jgi:hypothetical protein
MGSAVAYELEARLMVVNQQLALRQQAGGSRGVKGGRTKELRRKSEAEKERRGDERDPIERISRLFRAPPKLWTKKEALCLGKTIPHVGGWNWLLTKFFSSILFYLYGPTIFPPGIVQVRDTAAGL